MLYDELKLLVQVQLNWVDFSFFFFFLREKLKFHSLGKGIQQRPNS